MFICRDDSGATWHGTSDIPLTGDTIQCIAISNGYVLSGSAVLHDIAVGTAKWGDGAGDGKVWTFQIGGAFPKWTDQKLIPGADLGADVSAVSFSPRYSADQTILAVASDGSNTYLCVGVLSDSTTQSTTWNSPLPIDAALGDAPGVDKISSSIALPSDYDGKSQSPNDRKAFVSYYRQSNVASANNANDVYRFDDAVSCRLQVGGAADNVSSIAYFGTTKVGKLLAGEANPIPPLPSFTSQVRWTLNPLGIPPGTCNQIDWHIATQPPLGPGNAQVAWSFTGAVAFCGTGQYSVTAFDESAFSQSLDNGNNWAQTSLMNTIIRMTDIAPAPDSRSLFMATFSDFGPESVWRSAGEPLGRYWGRLLNMRSATDRVILRLSPNYAADYTLYAIEVDNITTVGSSTILSANQTMSANLLQISENRGNTWRKRSIPRPVIDVVAASQYTLYLATSGGYVRKSTDGGLSWGDQVQTGLNDINTSAGLASVDGINMLAISDNGHLFASSRDGWVAYSMDEGASFTKIARPVSFDMRDVQVVTDANYATNNVIYASGRTLDGTDAGVWRWTIGQSTQWEQIDMAITRHGTGEQISGLKVGPEGTLYALRAETVEPGKRERADLYTENLTRMAETGKGGMNRTLDPLYPIPEELEWDVINRTLLGNTIAFDPAPLNFAGNVPWLKLSGDSYENDLWAIDTFNLPNNDSTTAIYRFRDTLCKVGPWTTGPSEVGCDPVSGRNQQIDLSWEQLSLSDRYGLQLSKDPAFTLRIDPAISNSENISAVTGSILIKTDPVSVTSPAIWLAPGSLPEAGSDYYWRIRTYHAATGEYIRSPWSDILKFIVKPGFPVTTLYYGPLLLSPANGCACAYNVPVSFSWSPYKETTKYRFELSERSDMSRPLVSATVEQPGVPVYRSVEERHGLLLACCRYGAGARRIQRHIQFLYGGRCGANLHNSEDASHTIVGCDRFRHRHARNRHPARADLPQVGRVPVGGNPVAKRRIYWPCGFFLLNPKI